MEAIDMSNNPIKKRKKERRKKKQKDNILVKTNKILTNFYS